MPGTGSDGIVLLGVLCLCAVVVIFIALLLSRPKH